MRESVRFAKRRTITQWTILLLIMICLGSALAIWRWHAYVANGQQEQQRLEDQARAVSEHLARLLQGVNQVLLMAAEVPRARAGADSVAALSAHLRLLADASVAIHSLHILDADGSERAASGDHTFGSPPSDQPCFQRARAQPNADVLYTCGLFMAPSGRWSIHLLRAGAPANGGFNGAVTASLDIDYLNTTLPAALHGTDMRSILLQSNGVVIAAGHTNSVATGTDLNHGPGKLLERYHATGLANAVVEGLDPSDGDRRMVAYRRLRADAVRMDDAPLLAVSRGLAPAYRDWSLATWLCAAGWLLALGIGAAVVLYLRQLRRAVADEVSVLHRQRLAELERDITERKLIEQALRSSEESLSTTLLSIGDAVIATDVQGRVTRMNPTAERLTGWPADEALGRLLPEVFCIVNGHTRERVVDPVAMVLARSEIVELASDTVLIARDGGERQIADSAAPVRGLSGCITGVVVVFSDITEASRVQRALRDSESQLRLITDAVPGAVARYDLQRRFLFANQAHQRLLGLPPEQLIGRTLAEVYGEEAMAAIDRFTQRAEAGEQVTFEMSKQLAPAGHLDLMVTLAPDVDANGAVRGHFSVSTDITQLRTAEAERRALEEHLRESQKMDSIGTLAGGIAHDFNNVLGAIIGNAELARKALDEHHPARANLERISLASQRARGLVGQILTFSRKQPEHLIMLPLQPLIVETLTLLRSTLPARVELTTDITDTPLYVLADASQIQQVLMNLGTNAWHALSGGTGYIVVGLRRVPMTDFGITTVPRLPAGEYAHLWVSDDGTGMAATTRQRMFEPFFTTKPTGQGSGLGLSVVHGIVKTHRGAIKVETEPGQGTTIHLYLPATPGPSPPGEADAGEARIVSGRGQRVMYVDDDEVMLLMAAQLLEDAGYRVTTCGNAEQALAAFIEHPRAFDLVVTDFNMPDCSGLELAAELARLRPELPVLISSGYVSDELRNGARCAGVRHLMKKENTFEELAALVQRVLAEAESSRGPAC